MKKTYIWTFLVLLACYIILAFTLPSDPEVLKQYNLNQTEARLLNLTIVIPISIIYLSALYGFIRFKDYALSVRETKEGPHFNALATGLMFLAFTLPILSIIGSITSYVRFRHNDLLPTVTIIREYLALLLAFAALYFIAKGAQGLFSTLKNKTASERSRFELIGPIVLASLYTWLIATHSPPADSDQGYQLANWLVIATLAIPYIYIWCIGIKAAVLLSRYKDGVKGIVYKQAFGSLSKGIAVIILISIFIQFITTLSEQLNRLNLTPLLGVIYLLIVLYAVGYGFVAQGAKKLKRIEEA